MNQDSKKMKLEELKISSFVTELDQNKVLGGSVRAKSHEPNCPYIPTGERTGGNGEKG